MMNHRNRNNPGWIFLCLLTFLSSVSNAKTSSTLLGYHNNEDGSPLIPLIQAASSSIDIEIYEMDDENVLNALTDALNRGVTVRVVQDPSPLDAPCSVFKAVTSKDRADCKLQKKLVSDVKKAGGEYVAFNKSELCGIEGKSCFQHGKIAIFDASLALISTGNFNSTNLCDLSLKPGTCDRDYTYVSDDADVVSAVSAIFGKDLEGKRYDPNLVMTPAVSAKLTVSPISLDSIVQFIGSAQTSIKLENQYLEEPKINAALLKAAQRGVNVSITVASVCSFGKPSASKQRQITQIYGDFDNAGISSRFFTRSVRVGGKSGYLHAKTMVVDDSRAWLGSMNGSTESATQNREYGIYFDDPKYVAAMEATMDSDHSNPNSETWQDSLNCTND